MVLFRLFLLCICIWLDGVICVAATSMRVLSYNSWNNATRVVEGFNKTVESLQRSQADLVLLQESDQLAQPLAEQLKMNVVSYRTSSAILSRFPVLRQMQLPNAVAAIIDVDGDPLGVVAIHLSAYPYSPYEACFNKLHQNEIIQIEKNLREAELISNLQAMNDFFSGIERVVVGGDFNTPSHLDWITRAKSIHCGYEIAYPVSRMMEAEAFRDAFREKYPDPVTDPGNTWAPFEKWNKEWQLPEPQDRIDFVYYKGSLQNVSASVFSEQKSQWASDHAGVLVELKSISEKNEESAK